MIKLPDAITADGAPEVDEIYMAVDGMGLKGSYAAYAAGFNAAIEKVQRLNATEQPVSDWQKEAERMAELYGTSFVVFRHGEEPKCADPTKVRIEFTDERLGYQAAPGGQDEQ